MDRRRLMAMLPAALIGATFDPERLLWVPGQRTYFDIVDTGVGGRLRRAAERLRVRRSLGLEEHFWSSSEVVLDFNDWPEGKRIIQESLQRLADAIDREGLRRLPTITLTKGPNKGTHPWGLVRV